MSDAELAAAARKNFLGDSAFFPLPLSSFAIVQRLRKEVLLQ